MQIAIIGLGAMGSGLVRRLLAKGYEPIVWNRSPEPAEILEKEGATVAKDITEALAADVVFIVLYDDDAVRSVVLDPEHLKSIRSGNIVVGMSTISIALAEDLSDNIGSIGAHYVGGLMFGRPDKAESGQLQLAVGGAVEPVERITSILENLGTVWPMGNSPLDAHSAKLAGNYLIAASLATIGESAAIAGSTGGDSGNFLSMITHTLFNAPISQFHAGPIIDGEPPHDKAGLDIVLKDVLLGLEHGKNAGVDLPIAEAMAQRFRASQEAGFGEKSAYGIYELAKGKKA